MIDKKLIPAGVLKHDPATAAFLLGNEPPAGPPRSALQIHREAVGADPGELVKDRFLCRGAVGLIAGETSFGKSSLILQIATAWGMGRFWLERPTLRLWLPSRKRRFRPGRGNPRADTRMDHRER